MLCNIKRIARIANLYNRNKFGHDAMAYKLHSMINVCCRMIQDDKEMHVNSCRTTIGDHSTRLEHDAMAEVSSSMTTGKGSKVIDFGSKVIVSHSMLNSFVQ